MMDKLGRIILLSGAVSSGKSTLAKGLANRFGMSILKTSEIIVERSRENLRHNRKSLQLEGERFDRNTHGKWVLEGLQKKYDSLNLSSDIIVDSVRINLQIDAIREAYGPRVIHVHLTAPYSELEQRYNIRSDTRDRISDYSEVHENPTEKQVEDLAKHADIVIDTNRCTEQDVLIRTMAHLKTRYGRGVGYVDLVVGGQYGSEGKGQIVAHIAKEYDLLVRVGGPNAGHTVFAVPKPYAHHQLPSGTTKSEARLLIGPGAVLRVETLLKEIADCGVDSARLCIDGNAMIISNEDIKAETELMKNIGSTGQGVGAATARRIMGRNKKTLLARDIPELKPFLGSAFEVLENAFSHDQRVLIEGTQGTGLSLYHGTYPYVTSRDTTVMGC